MTVLNILKYAPLYDHLKLLVTTIGMKNSESASKPAWWQARGVWARVHAGNSTDKRGKSAHARDWFLFLLPFFETRPRFGFWKEQESHGEHAPLNLIQVRLTRLEWAQEHVDQQTHKHVPLRRRFRAGDWVCFTHRAVSSRGNRQQTHNEVGTVQSDLCLLWFSA